MTEALMPQGDTPRSAFGVLQRRFTFAIVGGLVALAAVSWWSTVGQAHDMSSMVQGIAQVGRDMPFDMSVGLFMTMWIAMMVAMMFPTIAPIVLLHRMVVKRRGEGPVPTAAFVGGYLIIWAAIGLIPLAALVGFRHIANESTWVARAGGGVLVIAGLYQFTRWKATCLKACRSPLSFLMTHDFGSGPTGALRVGVSHGLYCLGCCWALMVVLVVAGAMGLPWVLLIACVVAGEKLLPRGEWVARMTGVALAVLGVIVAIRPGLAMALRAASM